MTLTELGRGDFFGEMALLDGQRRSADAIVAEDARLAAFRASIFVSFVRSSPDVCAGTAHGARQPIACAPTNFLRRSATRNVNVEEAAQLTFADRASDITRGVWRQLEIHHCCGPLFQRVGIDQHAGCWPKVVLIRYPYLLPQHRD